MSSASGSGRALARELDQSIAVLAASLDSGLRLVGAGAPSDEVRAAIGRGRSHVDRAAELVGYLREFLRGSRGR